MLSPLQILIDKQDIADLRTFLAQHPDLDLNHITATVMYRLYGGLFIRQWALRFQKGLFAY